MSQTQGFVAACGWTTNPISCMFKRRNQLKTHEQLDLDDYVTIATRPCPMRGELGSVPTVALSCMKFSCHIPVTGEEGPLAPGLSPDLAGARWWRVTLVAADGGSSVAGRMAVAWNPTFPGWGHD